MINGNIMDAFNLVSAILQCMPIYSLINIPTLL